MLRCDFAEGLAELGGAVGEAIARGTRAGSGSGGAGAGPWHCSQMWVLRDISVLLQMVFLLLRQRGIRVPPIEDLKVAHVVARTIGE